MSADSPQHLIDQMSVQKVVASEMAAQMADYRATREQAAAAETASAKSAADARTAAQQAAAVRADVQAKQSKLQVQIGDRQVAVHRTDTRPAHRAGRTRAGPAARRRWPPDAPAAGRRYRRATDSRVAPS